MKKNVSGPSLISIVLLQEVKHHQKLLIPVNYSIEILDPMSLLHCSACAVTRSPLSTSFQLSALLPGAVHCARIEQTQDQCCNWLHLVFAQSTKQISARYYLIQCNIKIILILNNIIEF